MDEREGEGRAKLSGRGRLVATGGDTELRRECKVGGDGAQTYESVD